MGPPLSVERVTEVPEALQGASPPEADALATPVSPADLARLFDEFSASTRKLQESHAILEQRVVELRRQLAEKDQQLERKKRLEALGLMVAGVAHEIRNPLGGIALYLDCLSQEVAGEPSRESCQRLIGNIEDSIAHLNAVVENMLIFSAPSSGGRERCNLAGLVAESLQLIAAEVDRKGIDVSQVAIPGRPPEVSGHPDQLRCVFLNVFKNAVQAMDPGGALTVRFDGEESGGAWAGRISIRDTGPGIPEENLERVFVPFFTDGSKKGGVGLGLTIVHSLMEKHGGRVELANVEGGGLEVSLHFPAPSGPGTTETTRGAGTTRGSP